MNRKTIVKLIIAILAIVILLTLIKSIKNNIIQNAAEKATDNWAEDSNIPIDNYTVVRIGKNYGKRYNITIEWDGFEKLTPSQMSDVVASWKRWEPYGGDSYHFDLKYIISNGHTYEVDNSKGRVILNGKTIATGHTPSYSSGFSSNSSSSSSNKTATCNYCNGTGRVNGDKCPWCNGSGKTYDNVFNDALAD